jgi:hypothetical protein
MRSGFAGYADDWANAGTETIKAASAAPAPTLSRQGSEEDDLIAA